LTFGVSEEAKTIKRILIVRTDRLGDVVLTLPILPVLRRCFPDAFLSMLLKRYTGEIVEGNPYLDEIIWYDDGGRPLPFRTICRLLRQRKFDAAIVVYPRPRLAWLMVCAGIPVRIGTGYRYYSFLFTRRVYEHRKDAFKHEVEYNFSLVRQLGCTTDDPPEFLIDIPEAARARAAELTGHSAGRRIVVMHPGSGGSAREWPVQSFGSLAALLTGNEDTTVIVTGTSTEAGKARQVVDATGGRAISVAGALSVKELAGLLQRADLFVSNSTGPIHIAAAVGTPVVGFYPQHAAMSARRWGPWTDRKRILIPDKPLRCRECVRPPGQICECMASIPVDQALKSSLDLLSAGKGRAAFRKTTA
jgi:heptosyltransferase-2